MIYWLLGFASAIYLLGIIASVLLIGEAMGEVVSQGRKPRLGRRLLALLAALLWPLTGSALLLVWMILALKDLWENPRGL